MTLKQARIVAWGVKKNIGQLLQDTHSIKKNPSDWPAYRREEVKKQMSANMAQLWELYKGFPDMRPIKVRQMSLDL